MKKKVHSSLSKTETRFLETLNDLERIGAALNRFDSNDASRLASNLKLVAEAAVRAVTDSSAAIYLYDRANNSFESESHIAAEPDAHKKISGAESAPRPNGLGMRAIQRAQRCSSFEETELTLHPALTASGVQAVICQPLIVAEQAAGVLYVYLYQPRQLTPIEDRLLNHLARLAAMAVHQARPSAEDSSSLSRKEEELNRLRRAGLLISSRLRLEETLEAILQMALEMTHAQYGIFRLLDKSGEFLHTRAVGGDYLDRPMVERLSVNGQSIMAYAARTRQSLLIPDLREEPWSKIYYPLDAGLKMRSELAVPLINASGRLEGVLNLESQRLRAFSEEDSHLLQSLATYAVTAIQEVRLLDALQEVAQLLLSQPLQKVLDHLCSAADDLLNAASSAIWLLNDADELTLTASSGDSPPGIKLPLRGSLTGQAVLEKKPVAVDDLRSDPRAFKFDSTRADNWSRALIVPLLTGDHGQALGAFSVIGTDADAGRFTESEWDEKVLTFLANYAVLAIQNEARQQALRASQEQRWLAETFAAVGDISSNLLHNMNNKVGTIPVRVQTIQDKYRAVLDSDAYLANNLKEIERCAMEAMQIVQENLSHLRPIRMEPVHVAPRIAEAIHAAQLPAEIQVKLAGLDNLPLVTAGGQSLIFVFKNLIENAAEAMRGQGQIDIKGTSDADWVEITVTDSGPGIVPEFHDQIFELDFSGQSAMRPGKLGFGLWWVKNLMTRLGGSVNIESDGEHGATFRLRLPRAEIKG